MTLAIHPAAAPHVTILAKTHVAASSPAKSVPVYRKVPRLPEAEICFSSSYGTKVFLFNMLDQLSVRLASGFLLISAGVAVKKMPGETYQTGASQFSSELVCSTWSLAWVSDQPNCPGHCELGSNLAYLLLCITCIYSYVFGHFAAFAFKHTKWATLLRVSGWASGCPADRPHPHEAILADFVTECAILQPSTRKLYPI